MVLTAVFLLTVSVTRSTHVPVNKENVWYESQWERVNCIVAIILTDALVLPKLGYLVATFLLVLQLGIVER